jgi:DNA-binding MarR family transcriptional regulator
MSYENLKLDNQLCFALYASSKAVIKNYKPLLDKLGITYTQYITLLVLWEQDNITVKELGNKLYLDSGTLTPVIKRLEKMDLLERIRDSHDERNVYVKLLPKGISMKESALDIPKEIFCSVGMTLDDVTALREKLKSLLKTIEPTNE